MTKPVRVGLLGFGHWGPMFVRNFKELQGAEVAWVCDLDSERRDASVSRHPDVTATGDWHEALASDADAVVVATPPSTHFALAAEVLSAGKHVLVEKPISMRPEDALELGRLAAERNRVLMVGHILRYNPAIAVVRSVVDSGELGDLRYVASTRVNLGRHHRDVNVMWDLGPHDVSVLIPLLGEPPCSVNAWGTDFIQRGLHDVVFMYLRFPQGPVAHVHLSWVNPLKQREVLVVGSKRMLVYDDVSSTVTVHDRAVETIPHADTLEEFKLSYRYGDSWEVPVPAGEPLAAECAHFVECIRHGKEPVTGVRDGYQVVRVLDAAQRSLVGAGAEIAIDWSSTT